MCFLGGSLMLGATDGAHADVPPKPEQLGRAAKRDWQTGTELIRTCMETHKTKTCVVRSAASSALPLMATPAVAFPRRSATFGQKWRTTTGTSRTTDGTPGTSCGGSYFAFCSCAAAPDAF